MKQKKKEEKMTEIKVIRKGESKNFKVKVKGVTLKNKEIIWKVVEDLTSECIKQNKSEMTAELVA